VRGKASLEPRRAALLVALAVVLSSGGAWAGTTTGSLTVTATVSGTCVISSGGGTLSFGTYDPVNTNASTPLLQSGTFQIQCTNGTNATILLGQGSYPGNGSTDSAPVRNMSSGAAQLNYQLYTTIGRTVVWENVIGVSQVATGLAQTVTVYGSIPAGQNVSPGTYTDTVVISVNY
jgi:spore coat protein U-like protein